nr:unnamed protein product [Callosobruchus analis]
MASNNDYCCVTV